MGSDAAAITVVPRLLARRGGATVPLGAEYWSDTTLELPPELAGRFTNVFTGEALEGAALSLGRVLARFPVALLERRAA